MTISYREFHVGSLALFMPLSPKMDVYLAFNRYEWHLQCFVLSANFFWLDVLVLYWWQLINLLHSVCSNLPKLSTTIKKQNKLLFSYLVRWSISTYATVNFFLLLWKSMRPILPLHAMSPVYCTLFRSSTSSPLLSPLLSRIRHQHSTHIPQATPTLTI